MLWILLLIIPYVSTYKTLKSFNINPQQISYTPIVVMTVTLIALFYINYYYLVPKYLITKKYQQYFLSFIIAAITHILVGMILFRFLNLNPAFIEKQYPIIRKVGPIVRANAILMLVISFITSILLSVNNQLRKIEKEKLSAQLSSLKSQINPHFLFNTLNSIYVTAIEKSPVTAEMVQKLSEMMRYTMKDTQNDYVPIEEELQYIQNYIDLQKVRLDENIKLKYNVTGTVREQKIAPMLIIPFIENAFKHGVNGEEDSDLNINVVINDDEIHLLVENNKVQVQKGTTESSGLGIENTRSRLQMLYPNNYQLQIEDSILRFVVSLRIRLV
jgi:sensor histidine kinase YesM